MARRIANSRASKSRARGFTLVWCLAAVAIMGVYLMKVGDAWQMHIQREREFELRQVGSEIRTAIRRYVENGDGSYPRTLQDLVEDTRTGQTRRWLRRAWRDPITGADWQYLHAPGEGFMGVHSRSNKQPLKQSGFPDELADMAGAAAYADWRFAYWPAWNSPDTAAPQ
ncbi:type II secretion system protein [Cupriavidus sp. BIS7]|uniref:type II secretion system protein n=1 Tax=Cupriavidus sp. BIS7 TaxID=1217718 RepID=UPI0002DBCAEB|nr:type II secretion system protein [Cupriavidus sp. BIS7]